MVGMFEESTGTDVDSFSPFPVTNIHRSFYIPFYSISFFFFWRNRAVVADKQSLCLYFNFNSCSSRCGSRGGPRGPGPPPDPRF